LRGAEAGIGSDEVPLVRIRDESGPGHVVADLGWILPFRNRPAQEMARGAT
jgi:hypothetical protein